MANPLLTTLPLQQPFVVGPSYSPVPFKVVSQITAGNFVNLEDLLAENITPCTLRNAWLQPLAWSSWELNYIEQLRLHAFQLISFLLC